MALRKTDSANLRNKYHLFVEGGLVLSLVLLVVAVRVDISTSDSFEVQMEEQEVVDMEEIQQTEQEREPPPPPKPPVPVEVPNDEVIEEDDVDFDSSLDLDDRLDTDEGPPPGDDEEEEEEDEVFVAVEQQPDCGGVEALQDEVEYPDFARKAGIEGRVFVQFIVDEEGQVQNPNVTRGVHELLDEEALRAVQQLECEPGQQRGDNVKVQMSLPVTFKLQ
ncbi:MAG: energy transducer TonB [Salinibacter sp.]